MIKTTVEKMTCCSCDKGLTVSIMTDVDDEDAPELVLPPAGAFVTSLPLDDSEDGWFVACSTKCATEFIGAETSDDEDDEEGGEEVEIEETH